MDKYFGLRTLQNRAVSDIGLEGLVGQVGAIQLKRVKWVKCSVPT